ncbi:MAG: hypothetical protein HPY51_17175 [Candidatus Omnitrophica bacterium]|nr:hypothetical protein [Candidatus Omnitrophota bacterium]
MFVRTEAGTRGHVLVVMLAYLIVRALRRAWADFDCTVEEGLQQLATLSAMEIHGPGRLPEDPHAAGRIAALAPGIGYPPAGGPAVGNVRVVTRKKNAGSA